MKTEIVFEYNTTIKNACKALNKSIQKYIEKGYSPQGGVSTSTGDGSDTINGSASACILMAKHD